MSCWWQKIAFTLLNAVDIMCWFGWLMVLFRTTGWLRTQHSQLNFYILGMNIFAVKILNSQSVAILLQMNSVIVFVSISLAVDWLVVEVVAIQGELLISCVHAVDLLRSRCWPKRACEGDPVGCSVHVNFTMSILEWWYVWICLWIATIL
jgi:hypothetical protein